MSRLELGPEDNPNYVIDENQSGDLEVRDAGGSVIATYKQDGSTEVGTFSAEVLTNAADGGPWETLKEAGYEKGDVVCTGSYPAYITDVASTTSTTYVDENELGEGRVPWGSMTPNADSLKARISTRAVPGTDETMDIRFADQGRNTIAEVTGITSGGTIDSGWMDFTPSSITGVDQFIYQHRTNPGSNASNTNRPVLYFGVEI